MKTDKVKLTEKFGLIRDSWKPHIAGRLNGQLVKLAKFKGEFIWHKHEHEDEMFYVVEGETEILFKDRTVSLKKDEFIIVPRGIVHKPVAKKEAWVMLFEPEETVNTGDQNSALTQTDLQDI